MNIPPVDAVSLPVQEGPNAAVTAQQRDAFSELMQMCGWQLMELGRGSAGMLEDDGES